jgi:ABC-type antimicrobial peptide transport system permease subunit
VLSLDDAQRAFDRRGQVSYFNIKLKDARRGDEIQQAIEQRWPDLAATRAGDTNVQSEMLDLYRSFGWFLGLFAVLVGGLGMMNTTLMSVFERTREIGMLRAIGWRRRRIIGLIVGESLTLALAGGVLGLGLGAGLVAAVQLLPAVASLLSGVVSVAMIVQALVIALLLGLVGSLYPAWRAASLTPIEAMRADAGSAVHPGRIGQFMARIAAGGTLRNMWRRPTRTLVTMAGIGLAVGLIVALLAMTAGFVVMFSQLTGGKEGDLLAEQARVSDMALSTIDERLAGRIAIQPGVRAVSRLIFGLVSTPKTPYFILFGLDPGEPYAGHVQIREGRAIARSHEVMLGRFAATGMEKRPGDTLRLGGSSFRVVGIYENGSALEDSGGMVVVKDAQQVFHKPRQVSLLVIHLDDPGRADELAAHLETLFPELLIAKPATFSNRIQDMATAYAVLNTLIGLTLVVGGIVMTNTMLMSVFERTQEIGVLRAVGWHRGRVIRMVVAEALAVSLLSSAVGLLIGVTLNAALTLEPTMGRMLVPAYTPQLFLQAALLAIALGALGGLYPAWRAARLRPLDALRYE